MSYSVYVPITRNRKMLSNTIENSREWLSIQIDVEELE